MLIKLHRFNTAIMQNFRLAFLFFFVLSVNTYGQYNGLGFGYPLENSPVVTGNYGELRPNHFHAGIDFRTDPVVNLPIKSAAAGYVSRIKISSGGYGRVLYITHTNGYVTVYAHQKKYASKIDRYVRQKQLEQQKNEIELFPKPGELPIEKGEVVGYTGNTGSSTGPHLHFEIREEKTEIPVNPLLVYSIKDDVKPTLTHIAVYNTNDTNAIVLQQVSALNAKMQHLSISKNTFLLAQNTFAIGFSGYDQANGTTNKNNVYEAVLKLDGQLIYHHQLNGISFDNARYVNYFSEKVNGIKYQKCFSPTCFDIGIYKKAINGGRIVLKDTVKHTVELVLKDEKGNETSCVFYVKASAVKGYKADVAMYNTWCNKECVVKKEDVEFSIKPGTLTRSVYVSAYINKLGKMCVGNKNEQLMKPFTLSLKVLKPLAGKETKMVAMNEDNCLTGKYENGWFLTESKSFGAFTIAYDTVAPHIVPVVSKTGKAHVKHQLSFTVSDNLSGIADYAVYINGTWQIAEYDAKSSTITCYFDDTVPLGTLTIKAEVMDKVGNTGKIEVEVVRN